MAFAIHDLVGAQPIANTETTQRHPIGQIVQGTDPTYGFGKFIYLLGVASTVVGDLVFYDSTTGATTRVTSATTHDGQPVAVAMSANVASQYGWYQIKGLCPVKKPAVAATPNQPCFVSTTTGRVYFTASGGRGIVGMRTANSATVASGTSSVTCLLNYPSVESYT